MSERKIRLGAFIPGSGQHVASWRHDAANAQGAHSIEHYIELIKTAERGLFDAMFLADGLSSSYGNEKGTGRSDKAAGFEPLTLFSALSVVTRNIGFIATASTTYEEPYNLARKFASLDLINGGRSGWNLVTSANEAAARNFNLEKQVPHSERYERAEEFVDVAIQLWDSWEDDAFIADKASGEYHTAGSHHKPHHKGKHFSVEGGLNIPRSKQGRPVVVQAGQSEPGKELAARTAEVVFTAQQSLEDAQAFYSDVKARLAKYGRHVDELLIMPGITFFIGNTHEEAVAYYNELNSLIHPEVGLGLLSALAGGEVDLSQFPLDEPLPELSATQGSISRQGMMVEIARKHNFTIRQLYEWVAGARGHWTVIGTASEIADQLQTWFEQGAADGFNVLPPVLPRDLDLFVDQVIPELQRRGLFRTEYEGSTLRENLGLSRPNNSYSIKTSNSFVA